MTQERLIDLCCLVYRRQRTWQIIDYMRKNDGATQIEVAKYLKWSQPLTSQYFCDLKDTGLIKETYDRRSGRKVWVSNETKIKRIKRALVA